MLDTKSVRRVVNGSGLLALAEISTRFASLLIAIFVGRTFGASALGQVSVALAVAMYVQSGADFGFKTAGARLVAENPMLIDRVVKRTRRARATLFAISASAAGLYWYWATAGERSMGILFLFLMGAQGIVAVTDDWLLWGSGRISALGAYRVIFQLGATLFSILFLYLTGELWPVGLAFLLAAGAGFVFVQRRKSGLLAQQPTEVCASPVNVEAQLRFKRVVPLGCTVLLNSVYQTGELLVLQALLPWEAIGTYSAASRLVLATCALMSVCSQVLFPIFASARSDAALAHTKKYAFRIVITVAMAAALSIFILAPAIIHIIYGDRLIEAARYLRALAPAIVLDGACGMWVATRNARGQYVDTFLTTATGAGVNVIAGIALVIAMGTWGAVSAKLLAYAVMCAMIWQWRKPRLAAAT